MLAPPQPATPKDRLIFALDVDDLDTAEKLVRQLAPKVGVFKVGPVLFTHVGPLIIDLIQGLGGKVFLDLKFHDIPATVAGAAREASKHRVKMFTVHALGGRKMIEHAAGELLRATVVPGVARPMPLAVTILTSHEQADLAALGLAPGTIAEHGTRLAKMALEAGAEGVVASAHELSTLVPALPKGTIFFIPGIRGPGDAKGDQSRTMSAKEAIQAGATYVVVGRPIRDAKDPAGAAERIVEEIAAGLPS